MHGLRKLSQLNDSTMGRDDVARPDDGAPLVFVTLGHGPQAAAAAARELALTHNSTPRI
jgi:hypothetical protein